MGGAARVFSIRGIPIYIHVSWVLVYALITWTLAVGYFPRVLPNLPTFAYWVNGLIAALLLFVSVLLHELAHSFVARAYGLEVRGITLHIFGGVSHLADEAPSPRAEFLIAIAGPLTSFVTAAVAWGLAWSLTEPVTDAILGYVILVNVVVGIFNLLPGFPLDGGRVLRAILWKVKGNLPHATWIASRVGVGVAFALMGLGLVQILRGDPVGGIWVSIIGLFLRSAADASYAQIALRETLARIRVREVMARDVVSVPAGASITELADAFWANHFTSFPVLGRDGTVLGVTSLRDLRRVPREDWAHTDVGTVMQPLIEDLTIGPGESLFRAFEKASRNGLGRLAVLDGSRLVGYLSLKDITHTLALQGLGPDGQRQEDAVAASRPLRRAA